MKVAEIMTSNVVFCRKDTDLASAMRLMLDARVGTLPVLGLHDRLAGIITDRDIAAAVAIRNRNAAHIAVHEAFSEHVRCCHANDDLPTALRLMEDGHVRRLPVLGVDDRLAGIIALDDIVVHAVNRPGGVPSSALVDALTRICALPSVEPEMNTADLYVSG